MLNVNEGLLPALIEIYMMEKGISQFYDRMSRLAADERARTVFVKLAEMEAAHTRFIQNLYRTLVAGEQILPYEEFSKLGAAEIAEGGIPLDELEGKIDEFSYTDDRGAIKFALDIEAKEYALYKKSASEATDVDLRLVFENLMEWELKHIENLRELRKSLAEHNA